MTTFTSELPEFIAYSKIPRHRRNIIITEKIDGTNAVLHISEDGVITAGSRTRWIAPGNTDNHGFAQWVEDNHEDLLKLGTGYRFGEWYGQGVNRGYGLKEKRLALFREPPGDIPDCCELTPRIYEGPNDEYWIQRTLDLLREQGSYAVPGYMNPEGIVIFHTAGRFLTKITLKGDEIPKGLVK